jgi:MoaA/NifB/PqqE/SkfB family radical SAM enzyme
MRRKFEQFFFGMRVFFRYLTIKNLIKIINFIFKRYLRKEAIPFSVVFAVTYDCQCKCVHCSVGDCATGNKEMTTLEIKSLIDDIDVWGPIKITFFGGEPMMRPDLVELVSYAASKGIRCAVDTNGIAVTESKIKELKSAGIGNINVSIDSADPAIHDKLRKYNGCFDAALKAVRLCVNNDVPCLVSTYASNRSVRDGDLEAIIALAKKEGVEGVKILFPILSGRWRKQEQEALSKEGRAYLKSLLDPSYVYIEDALEMVKREGKGCSAIEKNLIYISPYGDVQPCPAIPVTFGNVRSERFTVIVKRMMEHVFYKKHKYCTSCLMNEDSFRKKYFAVNEDGGVPVDVEKII